MAAEAHPGPASGRARRTEIYLFVAAIGLGLTLCLPPGGARLENFRLPITWSQAWRQAGQWSGAPGELPRNPDDPGITTLLALSLWWERSPAELAGPPPAAIELPLGFRAWHVLAFAAAVALLARLSIVHLGRWPGIALTLLLLVPLRAVSWSWDVYLFPALAGLLMANSLALLARREWWARLLLGLACLGIVACEHLRSSSSWVVLGTLLAALAPAWVEAPPEAWRRVRVTGVLCAVGVLGLAQLTKPQLGQHVRWHPLLVGSMEFGGWQGPDMRLYPWFVPAEQVPPAARPVYDWSDQLGFQRARAVDPGCEIYSARYEQIARADVLALARGHPRGLALTVLRRAWRLLGLDPLAPVQVSGRYLPSGWDLVFRLVWGGALLGGLVARLVPPRPLLLACAGLSPLALPPLLVHSGYLTYNLGGQLPFYLLGGWWLGALWARARRRGRPQPAPPAGYHEPVRLPAASLWLLLVPLLGGCAAPGPLELRARSGGAEPAPFLAGVGEAEFTPGKGYPLGGYGGGARREEFPLWLGIGWVGRLALAAHMSWHEEGPEPADLLVGNEGLHDPLGARAVVLRPEGQPPLAIVRIDAIGSTSELHELICARVQSLGYAPERVLLVATHTHAGPGSFMRAPFACLVAMDDYRPEIEARMADACVAAIEQAHQGAQPATLGLTSVRDRGPDGRPLLAKNRRARRFEDGVLSPDDIDDEVGLVLLRAREDGAPLALLLNYAVHCTVLGPDNLYYSGDLAHGLEDALSARLGAPVLFLNGAEGDIAPRSLTRPGGLARCRELGQAFAELCAPALTGAPREERIALDSVWGEQEMGRPWTCLAAGRDRFLDGDEGLGAVLTAPLTLPANLVLWVLGFTDLRLALTWNFAAGVVLDLNGLLHRTRTRLAATRLRVGQDDLALVTIPGEPTHDVGLELKAQALRRGATRAFVLGLGLDHLGYVASEREYRRGGYEAWSTLFGPGTAARLVSGQERLLDELYAPPR